MVPRLRHYCVCGGSWSWNQLSLGSETRRCTNWPANIIVRMYSAFRALQEGFGIAFLEAMAAGKPIVAARAAAIPEVVRHGVLVAPENAEALADGIWRLWRDPVLRASIARQQSADVEEYEMISVTRRFLHEVSRVTR